jgi:hypothetical protein
VLPPQHPPPQRPRSLQRPAPGMGAPHCCAGWVGSVGRASLHPDRRGPWFAAVAASGPRRAEPTAAARRGRLWGRALRGHVWRGDVRRGPRRGDMRRRARSGRRVRCRRRVRSGSRASCRGRRGRTRRRPSSRFPAPFLRLRGCGCRQRSRNDKNCRDACVPLEHDTTSWVARMNQRRRRRAGFAREGATAYMGLTRRATYSAHDRFDDQLFRIACLKIPGD